LSGDHAPHGNAIVRFGGDNGTPLPSLLTQTTGSSRETVFGDTTCNASMEGGAWQPWLAAMIRLC
jgi:hypothetical protein